MRSVSGASLGERQRRIWAKARAEDRYPLVVRTPKGSKRRRRVPEPPKAYHELRTPIPKSE